MGVERDLLGSSWKEEEKRKRGFNDVGSTVQAPRATTKRSHQILTQASEPREGRTANKTSGHQPSGFQIIHSAEAANSNHQATAKWPSQRRFIIDWQSTQPFRTDATPSCKVKTFKVASHHTVKIKRHPVVPNYISFSQTKEKSGSANGMNAVLTHAHLQQPFGSVGTSTPPAGAAGKANIAGAPCKAHAPTAQMTIFYAGEVNVYENIPLDKAREIMSLASKESCVHSNVANMRRQTFSPDEAGIGTVNVIQIPVNKNLESRYMDPPSPVSITSGFAGGQTMPGNAMGQTIIGLTSIEGLNGPSLFKALPMARKASLARFLKKRKERLANSAPYTSIPKAVGNPMSTLHCIIEPESPNTRLEI